jgi:regulator of protease activity HflC (stomatin/prohibitin superfamily)
MTASLLILLAAVMCAAASLRRVPDGQAFVVHRFGSYRRTLPAGLHWLMPLVERVARRVSLTGQRTGIVFDWRTPGTASQRLSAQVWFQIIDPARGAAEVDDVERLVTDAALAAVRWLGERRPLAPGPELARALKDEFNVRLRARGIAVTRVDLPQD